MKVGNLVNGLAVIDVKRVNKMNIIQFTKAVSEFIDQGYELDVNSARQVGLVLMVDLFKTEEPKAVEGEVLLPLVKEVTEQDSDKPTVAEDEPEVPVKKPVTSRAKKTT